MNPIMIEIEMNEGDSSKITIGGQPCEVLTTKRTKEDDGSYTVNMRACTDKQVIVRIAFTVEKPNSWMNASSA